MANNNETTTKFRVDVSELKKGMQDAKRAVAVANSEFREAASTCDDWSKSSVGLSAKLKQLDTNLKSQKTILSALEAQYEAVVAEQGEGSKAADDLRIKINNQKAAINNTEKEISKYSSALKDVTKAEKTAALTGKDVADVLDDMGNEAEDAGDGFTTLKGAVATFVGNALTELVGMLKEGITSLVSFSDEADRAMDKFKAATGATAEEMAEFEDVIKNIYNGNYGESFEDIAESMATVKNTMGDWLGAEGLEILTKNALLLRDTFGFEVNESIRAANSLINQFGIDGELAYELIAQGAQNGLNQNGDLLDVINEYAVQFASAGYEANDMFNMLANGVSTGTWSVDKLGDALKEMNIRFSDGTVADALAENRKALGLTQKEVKGLQAEYNEGGESAQSAVNKMIDAIMSVEDETERYKLGVSVFGTMWEDLGADTIAAMMNTTGSIDMAKDAMEQINDIKYDSVGAAMQGIGRNLQTGILMPIGDKLLPIVSDLAAKFKEWLDDPATQEGIKAFTDSVAEFVDNGLVAIKDGIAWFLENKDAVIAGLVAIGAGFAAFKVVSLIQGVQKAMEGMTVAQWLLNAAMNANPIGLIVAAIAALVAGFVYLWNNCEGFRNFWIGLWENIKSVFEVAVQGIVTFFTETLPNVFNSVIEWIKTNWQSILLFMINPFAGLFKYFYDNSTKFKEFVDTAINYIKELPAKFKEFVSQIPYYLGYIIGQALGQLAQWGINLYKFATTDIPKFINKVIEFFKQLPSKIWTWLVNTIAKVTTWRSNMITKAKEAATGFINKVVEIVKDLPSKVWTWLSNVVAKVNEWKSNLVSKGKEAAQGLFDSIVDKIKELPERLKSIGSDIVRGLWNGINDMTSWIAGKIQSFGDGVLSGIKDFFGINSPSKVMAEEVGKWLPAGLAVGIDKNAKSALSAMKDLAVNTVGAASAGLKTVSTTTSGFTGGTGGVVNNFTQNNYSPKALSRLDIYRQSKNLLGFAGGGR